MRGPPPSRQWRATHAQRASDHLQGGDKMSEILPDTGAHDPCQYHEDGFEGEPIVFRAGRSSRAESLVFTLNVSWREDSHLTVGQELSTIPLGFPLLLALGVKSLLHCTPPLLFPVSLSPHTHTSSPLAFLLDNPQKEHLCSKLAFPSARFFTKHVFLVYLLFCCSFFDFFLRFQFSSFV